jgi:hypothetical protein
VHRGRYYAVIVQAAISEQRLVGYHEPTMLESRRAIAMRATRRHAAVIALASTIAAGALGPGALASTAMPPHASVLPRTPQLEAVLAVLVTKRTVIPKVQRTIGFTGYAMYTFSAPRGGRIVSASARIVGAAAHAVAIRRKAISHNRTRYTVSLVFPDEQGKTGKLVVRLGTVG